MFKPDDVARLYSKYHVDADGCWIYTGSPGNNGYGQFTVDRTNLGAHVASYLASGGKLVGDQQVLHSCDKKLCIKPSCLFAGTQTENIRDKVDKQRQAKGDMLSFTKLSATDVVAIRKKLTNGAYATVLAKEYNVSQSTILNVKSGRTFKWVR